MTGRGRETREGWPLLTGVNGVSWSTNKRDPSLVGSLGFRAGKRDFCSALAALVGPIQNIFYVLLPYIVYVMQSRRFSQHPAFISRTAKERDKKYIVKSPQRYKM